MGNMQYAVVNEKIINLIKPTQEHAVAPRGPTGGKTALRVPDAKPADGRRALYLEEILQDILLPIKSFAETAQIINQFKVEDFSEQCGPILKTLMIDLEERLTEMVGIIGRDIGPITLDLATGDLAFRTNTILRANLGEKVHSE